MHAIRWDWLEATTGPVMLWGAVEVYKRANNGSTKGLTILPVGAIYPIDWRVTVWGPKDGPGWLPGGPCCACALQHVSQWQGTVERSFPHMAVPGGQTVAPDGSALSR